MKDPYPAWSHFPKNERPPVWVDSLLKVVADHEATLSTIEKSTGLSSDQVLRAIGPGLEEIGFITELSKKRSDKIIRPSLYGHNGEVTASYELDAFHEELGIAVEVEAGQSKSNNNDYRDIVRTSLLLDVRYLVLVVPISYRSGQQVERTDKSYERARGILEAIYASSRLRLPFEGVLVVGY
jgi:hypothetical protein